MYILPFYIRRYKAKIKADCFVKDIRFNTMNMYDADGYMRQSNPRALICRNEKDKAIILKDRPYYSKYMGGTTAIMIADGEGDEQIITTIAYRDWGGSLWNGLLIIAGIYGIIAETDFILTFLIIAFIVFMNYLDKNELIRQREFIEKTINYCELKKDPTTSAKNPE